MTSMQCVFFTQFPLDVVTKVFTSLTQSELIKLRGVNRRLNQAVDNYIFQKNIPEFLENSLAVLRYGLQSQELSQLNIESPISDRLTWVIEGLARNAIIDGIYVDDPFNDLFKKHLDRKNIGVIKKLIQEKLGNRLFIAALDCPMFMGFEDGTLYGRCSCGVWTNEEGSNCFSNSRIKGLLLLGAIPTKEILSSVSEGRMMRKANKILEDYALRSS